MMEELKELSFFTLLHFLNYLETFFHFVFECIENCLLREDSKEKIEIT